MDLSGQLKKIFHWNLRIILKDSYIQLPSKKNNKILFQFKIDQIDQ
jgi:hypothetical protein